MKKVNIKVLIPLGLLAISAIVLINGVTFGVGGKFFFTTKYYKTATQAFSAEYTPVGYTNPIEINHQLDVIQIDDENCLFLAITNNGELLMAQMICKNKKFAYMGNYCLYDSESVDEYLDNEGFVKNTIRLYHNGKADGDFNWSIIFRDDISLENYDFKKYTPGDFKDFTLVFFN